jgi:hypothetical protein
MKSIAGKRSEYVDIFLIPADQDKNQDETHMDVYGKSLEATSETRDNMIVSGYMTVTSRDIRCCSTKENRYGM